MLGPKSRTAEQQQILHRLWHVSTTNMLHSRTQDSIHMCDVCFSSEI
uniref:Uncharacterized protein n=1 Tax=Arundo donax TaxID=35708 RepID=A0A0A9GRZ9_ARUDO